MYRAAAVTLLLVVASSASAQVIYEPVEYQHTNGMTYYYGGNDPSMKHYIEHVKCRNGYPSAITGGHSNSLRHTLGQIGEQSYVFSDCLGYRNAAVYGYTSVDARNEANNAVPRYFRKSELLEAAVPQADGTFVVPASGKSHHVPAYEAPKHNGAATQPATTQPRAIIRITPRKAPKPQADEAEVRKVVAAAN
jgi:hypothetical protein